MAKVNRKSKPKRKYWLSILVVVLSVIIAPTIIQSSKPKNLLGEITVYLTPNCGCCKLYTKYLENRGFKVKIIEMEDLSQLKNEIGIPPTLQSCHTSFINGYFIEGHVPVEAIIKLLNEKQNIAGIVLPGMPSGSPGMPGGKDEPFKIYAIKNGSLEIFMII